MTTESDNPTQGDDADDLSVFSREGVVSLLVVDAMGSVVLASGIFQILGPDAAEVADDSDVAPSYEDYLRGLKGEEGAPDTVIDAFDSVFRGEQAHLRVVASADIVPTTLTLDMRPLGGMGSGVVVLGRVGGAELTSAVPPSRPTVLDHDTDKTADDMTVLSQLAGGLGHEINNPLTFISGNIDLALESLETLMDPRHADTSQSTADVMLSELLGCLTDAREGARRVAEIVGHLRRFARADDAPEGPLCLVEVVEGALVLCAPLVSQRARLVKALNPVSKVDVSGGYIRELVVRSIVDVLGTLSAHGGVSHRLTVRTTEDAESIRLEFSVHSETGSEAPESKIETQRQPSASGQFEACRTLASSVGAALSIERASGGALTLGIAFPLAPADHAQPDGGVPTVVEPSLRRVLVVDDEPLVGRLMARSLRGAYEVIFEEDATRVLPRLVAGERYHAILCDVLMASMTGIAVYDALNADYPEQASRMVFITGGCFAPEVEALLEATGRPRLGKPFDFKRIMALVDEQDGS